MRCLSFAVNFQVIRQLLLLDYSLETQQSVIAMVDALAAACCMLLLTLG